MAGDFGERWMSRRYFSRLLFNPIFYFGALLLQLERGSAQCFGDVFVCRQAFQVDGIQHRQHVQVTSSGVLALFSRFLTTT